MCAPPDLLLNRTSGSSLEFTFPLNSVRDILYWSTSMTANLDSLLLLIGDIPSIVFPDRCFFHWSWVTVFLWVIPCPSTLPSSLRVPLNLYVPYASLSPSNIFENCCVVSAISVENRVGQCSYPTHVVSYPKILRG